jgi:hypothetical protein
VCVGLSTENPFFFYLLYPSPFSRSIKTRSNGTGPVSEEKSQREGDPKEKEKFVCSRGFRNKIGRGRVLSWHSFLSTLFIPYRETAVKSLVQPLIPSCRLLRRRRRRITNTMAIPTVKRHIRALILRLQRRFRPVWPTSTMATQQIPRRLQLYHCLPPSLSRPLTLRVRAAPCRQALPAGGRSRIGESSTRMGYPKRSLSSMTHLLRTSRW